MPVIIEYDQPIEVTRKQYEAVSKHFTGLVAFQEVDGKFFIKLWYLRYATALNKLLDENNTISTNPSDSVR